MAKIEPVDYPSKEDFEVILRFSSLLSTLDVISYAECGAIQVSVQIRHTLKVDISGQALNVETLESAMKSAADAFGKAEQTIAAGLKFKDKEDG